MGCKVIVTNLTLVADANRIQSIVIESSPSSQFCLESLDVKD